MTTEPTADILLLSDDGTANADVVLAPDAPPLLRDVTVILLNDLRLATGAEFSLTSKAKAKRPVRIIVGSSGDTALPLAELRDDGYFIWTIGADIHLGGANVYGAANAVAAFIRDVLLVKHYMPGPLFTCCPPVKPARIPAAKIVSNPAFPTRAFGLANPLAKEWCTLNHVFNKSDTRPFIAASRHNIGNLFMDAQLIAEHPEYFALRNGRRETPAQTGGGKYDYLLLAFIAQPCYSNPGVVAVALSAARAFFDAHPEEHTFCLGVNDTETYCECASCAARDVDRADTAASLVSNRRRYLREHGHAGGHHSNVYFHFVNEVAKGLKASHPEKFVGCLAYEAVEEPPTSIDRLEDNVCICLTQDSSQYFDAEYRTRDHAMVTAWREKCRHVMKYDYYGLMWYFPRVYPGIVEEDIRNSARAGLVGMYSETHPIWPFTGPMLYLGARLLWDPALDGQALLDDFYSSLYGAAAADVAAFYELYEMLWKKPRPGRWFQGLLFPPQLDQFSRDEVEQAHARLIAGRDKLPHGLERERVEYLCLYHEAPLNIIRAYSHAIASSNAADFDAFLFETTSALAALAKLMSVHARILEDPVAESTMWTGFRYDAVWRFLDWRVRDALIRAFDERLPRLSAGDLEHIASEVADVRHCSLMRMHAARARQTPVVRHYLAFDTWVEEGTPPAEAWAVLREDATPGVAPVALNQVAFGDGAGVALKGAGRLSLSHTVESFARRTVALAMPVSTPGISLLTELWLELAWVDSDGAVLQSSAVCYPDARSSRELVESTRQEGDSRDAVTLELVDAAPERAAGARVTIRFASVIPEDTYTLGAIEYVTAEL